MLSVFEYNTVNSFLIDQLKVIQKENPLYSLRAFAKKLNISKSMLSACLSNKAKLSPTLVIKIANALQLKAEETNFLLNLSIMCQLEDGELRVQQENYINKLRKSKASTLDPLLNEFLKKSTCEAEFSYQCPSSLDMRTLIFLKTQNNPNMGKAFIDRYLSIKKQVASTSYFLPNSEGEGYSSRIDKSFGPTVSVDLLSDENNKIDVTFDVMGFPQINEHIMLHQTKNKLVKASQFFSSKSLTINYFFIDDESKLFSRSYLRVL